MPKSKDLTIRERKLIKGILSGLSGAEAARQAGYSERSARSLASETLSKPDVREALLKAMNHAGVTDQKLSEVMADGLHANRTISAVVINRTSDVGEEREADEETKDFVEVPDHATRHKFLETAIEVKGAKAPREAKVSVAGMEQLLGLLDDDDDGSGETQDPGSEG